MDKGLIADMIILLSEIQDILPDDKSAMRLKITRAITILKNQMDIPNEVIYE